MKYKPIVYSGNERSAVLLRQQPRYSLNVIWLSTVVVSLSVVEDFLRLIKRNKCPSTTLRVTSFYDLSLNFNDIGLPLLPT